MMWDDVMYLTRKSSSRFLAQLLSGLDNYYKKYFMVWLKKRELNIVPALDL